MRRIRGGDCVAGPTARCQLVPVEQAQVVGTEAELPRLGDILAEHRPLRLAARQAQRSAVAELHVDADGTGVAVGEGRDLVDRVDQRPLQPDRRLATMSGRKGAETYREQRRAPAAVAAARPEADPVALDDAHPQPGLGPLQCQGGPQPGVAGADDGDVGVVRETLGGGHRIGRGRGLRPEGTRSPVRHRGLRYARSMRDHW